MAKEGSNQYREKELEALRAAAREGKLPDDILLKIAKFVMGSNVRIDAIKALKEDDNTE